jgi:hypothetical protein
MIKQKCIICGNEFNSYPSWKKQGRKTCSRKCLGILKSKEMKGEKHFFFGKHHTEEVRKKISMKNRGVPNSKIIGDKNPMKRLDIKQKMIEAKKKLHIIPKTAFKKGHLPWNKGKKYLNVSGKNNWNWKGGITPENEQIRKSVELKEWKRACLRRDSFTCQRCGRYGGNLEVHHINNFAEFSELRTALDNGITLCKNCHLDFHKKYGFKNNTKGQLEEFLNYYGNKI